MGGGGSSLKVCVSLMTLYLCKWLQLASNVRMIPFSRPSEWRYLEGTCHSVGHTWRRSCVLTNLELNFIIFYEGLKIYLPLYLVKY